MLTKPLFQIALDYVNGSDALTFAGTVHEYADILGVGTLLLKREGVRIIRELKRAFPQKRVYADTKTIDLGQLEAELVFDAGADMMSVCGAASDRTIELAIKAGRARSKHVLIDLIAMEASYRQIKRLSYFQPDYIIIHAGVDEWQNENTLFQKVEIISQICPVPMALAGGIQLDDIPYLMVFQPSIIVVGSAITKSSEPQKTAQSFWENIHGPFPLMEQYVDEAA